MKCSRTCNRCDRSNISWMRQRQPRFAVFVEINMAEATGIEKYTGLMATLRSLLIVFVLAGSAVAQQSISFPTQDGGLIFADLYGGGDRAVVLAHGGRFKKESWQ